MTDDKRVGSQSGSVSGQDGSTNKSAKASYSWSGSFSWGASASASASASTSSSKGSSSKTASASYHASGGTSSSRPSQGHQGPTVDAPFEFVPVEESGFIVEEITDDEPDKPKPIAVPQMKPFATSPFLTGYPPSLRTRDISKETWMSFLDTVSAFLEARVSDQAVSHAMDVATRISKRPQKLASNVASRTAAIGQDIGDSAKRGNVLGVTTGVIKGAVSIPLNLVMSTVTGVLGLPISTAIAVTRSPPTPRDRATAYLAVANEQWLVPRRLFAGLATTTELGDLLGVPVSTLPITEEVDDKGEKTEETQYSVLEGHVEDLEKHHDSLTQIGADTLWLVVTQVYQGTGS